jgi:hypothetical protein
MDCHPVAVVIIGLSPGGSGYNWAVARSQWLQLGFRPVAVVIMRVRFSIKYSCLLFVSKRVRRCKAEEPSWQRNFPPLTKTKLSELRRRQTLLSTIHVTGS